MLWRFQISSEIVKCLVGRLIYICMQTYYTNIIAAYNDDGLLPASDYVEKKKELPIPDRTKKTNNYFQKNKSWTQ